jgi:CheY-like chemotaxis protein
MSRHVFCVDGAASFLVVLRELFEEEGYRVSTADYSPDISDRISQHHPDLVILDLSVGTSEGWDLLAQIEESASTANLPVVIVSTDPRQLAEARAATPAGRPRAYRAKPFNIDDLVRDVEGLIGRD